MSNFADYFSKRGRKMTIDIRNLTKIFGTQKALNNVTLAVDKGEIVGLLWSEWSW